MQTVSHTTKLITMGDNDGVQQQNHLHTHLS